ncbi:MAG: CoA-binding protein [Bacteroidia bacterium]|nr:CoA-binding protein [Bacteroidia bacterium]
MQENKRTLVIGASPKMNRYSYIATQLLQEHNYEVVPYGIKKGDIGTLKIMNQWPNKESFDTITLYINPILQEQYIQQILDLNPKRIIFNPGTENEKLERMAQKKEIQTLNACTLVLLQTNQY